MKRTVHTAKPYDVHVGRGLLANTGELCKTLVRECRVSLLSDESVYALYGETVCRSLRTAGYDVIPFTFPGGESAKSLDELSLILDFLSENAFTRSDLIVALGGGVTGDLSGFAAACYLRGISYVQIPTTLLAAVDASVGGKTAINLKAGKNLAGAFWQPILVLCDCDTFRTLPRNVWMSGIAECVKYGILFDETLFDIFTQSDLEPLITDVVYRCVSLKADIVCGDERDTGQRQLLNLGHTVGHAVEKLSLFSIPHGCAVSIGMCVMAKAAEKMGVCQAGVADAIVAALSRHGLSTESPYSADMLARAAMGDKKRMGQNITLVLPEKIGKCRLHPVDVAELATIFRLGMETTA